MHHAESACTSSASPVLTNQIDDCECFSHREVFRSRANQVPRKASRMGWNTLTFLARRIDGQEMGNSFRGLSLKESGSRTDKIHLRHAAA